MARGGLGRLEKGTAIGVVVYDQSMKMDGPCPVNRCRTDGNWKMKIFFGFFCPNGTFTCWGYDFLIFVTSIII